MATWTAEIKELEKPYETLKDQLPDLGKELERLIRADDENMILLYSRRCLEVIITDLCECELKRPRKTEPLKGIIDKLHKEEKVPSHIIASMHGLNELSTYGAHPKDFDPEQVKPVLNNLAIIVKWYLKYKSIVAISKTEGEGEKGQLRDEIFKEKEIEVRKEAQAKPTKINLKKLVLGILVGAIIVIAAIIAYTKIFKRDTLERLRSSDARISIAVMPFQNMTNDTILNVWEEGIQNDLISFLSNYKELKVIQIESINNLLQSRDFTDYTSISSSVASTISQKLDANIFIYGSIKQAGSTMRVNAQLINSKTEEALKSIEINEPLEEGMILSIIDSLKRMVRDFLIISKLAEKVVPDYQYFASTNSPEAYNYFVYGQNAYRKGDNSTAVKMYLQAVAKDTNFIYGIIQLTLAYRNLGLFREAKEWCKRVYKKRDQMPMQQKIYTNWIYAFIFETPYDEIKYLRQFQEIDNQFPIIYLSLGRNYLWLDQFDKAIFELEKTFELYNKSGSKPYYYGNYTNLGIAYHKAGQYKKEKQLYKKAEQDFPDNPAIIYRQAILALFEGKSETANDYIEKYKSVLKENSATEATITSSLASIYTEAEILDKAEEYYRQALSLEPNSTERMNTLAYFLIVNDRNINEGLGLVDNTLELSPDNYNYLHTKGWGLYKQGKYQEALETLQKSWDLRREQAVYNHEAYLHLEEAKKAVAVQKNN
jgi:tetratricopeptide (TPR) repeat protein